MDPYQGDHITVCMARARDGEGGGTESAQSEGRVKEREKEGLTEAHCFLGFFTFIWCALVCLFMLFSAFYFRSHRSWSHCINRSNLMALTVL